MRTSGCGAVDHQYVRHQRRLPPELRTSFRGILQASSGGPLRFSCRPPQTTIFKRTPRSVLTSHPVLYAGALLHPRVPSLKSLALSRWLDHASVKSMRYRPAWYKYVYGVFIASFLALGYFGSRPPSALGNYASQAGAIFYFGFFLTMPWWSRLGRSKAVPERVTYTH